MNLINFSGISPQMPPKPLPPSCRPRRHSHTDSPTLFRRGCTSRHTLTHTHTHTPSRPHLRTNPVFRETPNKSAPPSNPHLPRRLQGRHAGRRLVTRRVVRSERAAAGCPELFPLPVYESIRSHPKPEPRPNRPDGRIIIIRPRRWRQQQLLHLRGPSLRPGQGTAG